MVAAFLKNNFGNPVVIPDRNQLHKLASSQLFKHNIRSVGGNGFPKEYSEEVELALSFNNFRYDGFQINFMNTRNFNEAVSDHIRNLWRTNIDSLMISQEKQTNWKEKFFELMGTVKGGVRSNKETAALEKQIRKELEAHEINIKQAINFVIEKTLKLDYNVLQYETVKKDYYRYRNPEQYEKEKKRKKNITPLSLGLDLFSELDTSGHNKTFHFDLFNKTDNTIN